MANPELNEDYQARVGEAAQAAFETLRRSKDLQQIHIAAERYYASEFGVRLSSLQADLYLELGWSLACLRAAQEISPELRLPAGEEADLLDTLPAWLAWRNNSYWRKNSQGDEELLQRTREQLDRPIAIAPNRRTRLAEAFRRVAQASGIAPQEIDRKVLQGWMRSVVSLLDEGPRKELTELFEATSQWNVPKPQVRGIPCLGVTEQRGGVMPATLEPIRKWPVWSRTVPRFTATTDSTPASKPRVGETAMGTLAYYPVVHDELLLINTLSQILAFELDKGAAWPQPGGARALFDSRTAHTALVPLNFPLTGTARATLTVSGNELFARMGNPVSGWFSPRPTNDAGSSSYLVGLDLARQGTMLPGFPIRLVPPDFEQAEFEGSPLVIGDLVVSGVTQRDEVGLTRRVAAFGREDGQLRWLSKALASGSVEGMDRANLISHQLLSYAGGCLFYRTGLGVVACLEVTSGKRYG